MQAAIAEAPGTDVVGPAVAKVILTNATGRSAVVTVPVFVTDESTVVDAERGVALRAEDFSFRMSEFPRDDAARFVLDRSRAQAWDVLTGEDLTAEIVLPDDPLAEAAGTQTVTLSARGVERAIAVTIVDEAQWVDVRIPTKMLFGTLDVYENGKIVSPLYEIENGSDLPVSVSLARFDVVEGDRISLMSGPKRQRAATTSSSTSTGRRSSVPAPLRRREPVGRLADDARSVRVRSRLAFSAPTSGASRPGGAQIPHIPWCGRSHRCSKEKHMIDSGTDNTDARQTPVQAEAPDASKDAQEKRRKRKRALLALLLLLLLLALGTCAAVYFLDDKQEDATAVAVMPELDANAEDIADRESLEAAMQNAADFTSRSRSIRGDLLLANGRRSGVQADQSSGKRLPNLLRHNHRRERADGLPIGSSAAWQADQKSIALGSTPKPGSYQATVDVFIYNPEAGKEGEDDSRKEITMNVE